MGFDGISRRQHASCKCFLVDDKKKKKEKEKNFSALFLLSFCWQ
jgi:hypothetical protein